MPSVSLERHLPDHPKYPFEYARVGSLEICENLFLTLKKLCENHIQNLEEQREQDLECLFSDTAALASATSPWSRFSLRDVEYRKRYLTEDLLPWIQVHCNMLQNMCDAFARQWRRDCSRRVTEHYKAILEKILRAGRGLEHCFQCPAGDGPFYIGLEDESREWRGGISEESRQLQNIFTHQKARWYESDGTRGRLREHPIEQSKERTEQLTMEDNAMCNEVDESLLNRGVFKRAGRCDIRMQLASQARRHPLRVAATFLVSISLFVSLAWSIARRDPQTGFTIGGFISAAGGIAIAVAKHQRNSRKVALG